MIDVVEGLLALLATERQMRMRNELSIDGHMQRTGEQARRLRDRISSLELQVALCRANHTDQPTPWVPVEISEEVVEPA